MIQKIKYIIIFLFLSSSCYFQAQVKKDKFLQTTLSLGPALTIHKGNSMHTSNMRNKPGFNATTKLYLRLNRIAFFYFGANYLAHGCSFNSYYFTDSTLHLYTQEYEYNYNALFQDIAVPIGIRAKITENKQKKNDLYVELGWALKKRFVSELDVSSNSYGTSVYYDFAGDDFGTRFAPKKTGTSLLMALGYDRNFRDKRSGYFIELQLNYSLNKFYFIKHKNFPNNLYLVERFIAINAGIRF